MSTISRPKWTISRYGVKHGMCRLPTGSPSRCYDVLDAPRTRRASPLLAGFARAIQLPDKEFRSDLLLVDLSSLDRRVVIRHLLASPQGSDHIFASERRLACGL